MGVGSTGLLGEDSASGVCQCESSPGFSAAYRMHPTPGPPSDTPATRSVWKVLFHHLFESQPALSSNMSVSPLPRTVLLLTLLDVPSARSQIPNAAFPFTVLSVTVFAVELILIPKSFLLVTLFWITFLSPLKMATPYPSPPPPLLLLMSHTSLILERTFRNCRKLAA